MSHFTRIETRLAEREPLVRALRDLGYAPEVGALEARGHGGRREPVEIRLATRNPGFDIGFARGASGYELVADWWGIRDVEPERLLRQVTQRYAYHATRMRLEAQGFAIAEEVVEADGRIRLVLRRMV
ncbi:MAG: DUF1257 domain-containing protein [Planctomycetes bacterium]|nr:DUF1257 domain-containing protein [Planctomycetota bacterium]